MKNRKSRVIAGAIVALGLAVTTACSGSTGGDASGEQGSGETAALDKVKVGLVPVLSKADFYLGLDQGFFEEEGLDVEALPIQTGAAITASVIGGDVMIGAASTVPLLIAEAQDVPVQIIASGTISTPPVEGEDYPYVNVIVKEGSDIQSAADLDGKRIGVTGVKSAIPLIAMEAAALEGADPSTFELVGVDFPDLLPALDGNQVDAIVTLEPFTQQALAADNRVVVKGYPFDPSEYGELTTSAWFTSVDQLEENRDIIERFVRALQKSSDYAMAHPEEARQTITEFTQVSPELADSVALEAWPGVLDVEGLEALADLIVKYEFAERADVSNLVSDIAPLK